MSFTEAQNNKPANTGFGVSLFAAFFICILEIIFVLAFTALIYSGDLASQIPRALGFVIFGDAVLIAVVAALSSYPSFIGLEQDAPGAMQGVIAASIIAALVGSTAAQFATVTLMVVITSLMTGVLLLALGYFKLGGLARFLPYPVIGGFLAGTGWLLIQGGIGIMVNLPVGLEWFRSSSLVLWGPGFLLGLIIYFITKKINKPYTIPLLLVIATFLFYGIVWATSTPISDLRLTGWLLESHASSTIWQFPLSPAFLSDVDWSVLRAKIPSLLPVTLISVIGLLLNSSGMEVMAKKDIDLNRELMVAGIGNLSSGLVGGLVGFQDVSFTTLNRMMTGGKRLVGLLTALMLGSTLFIGTTAFIYIPKFVFGSVLIYLGFELLINWVYDAWFKFSRIEFLSVVVILITLVVRGVLEGVIVGLILAVVMFVVSYSRVSVIKFAFTGREYRSRVTRALYEQKILDEHGSELYIMKLEGFIFFGTANGIFAALRERVKTGTETFKYCLIDFSKVSGIDSTGMLSFNRMLQWTQEQGITLILAGLDEKSHAQFKQLETETGSIQFLPSLDRGLEWCENTLIAHNQADLPPNIELKDQLNAILKSDEAEKLLPYLQRHDYRTGEYLIREGDNPDFVYFIHSGQVTAQLESLGKKPVRLETMYSGRTVGELAFYLGTKRTASVVADQDSVVYSLSMEELKRLESDAPEVASIFHRISVFLLSERVSHLIRTVRALERA
jgi:SulP family sulfate permease